jgi:UDPglucose--hexose-1-phosphate uridylyltransferase
MTSRLNRTSTATPDLRHDPISGRTVVIAPARENRPGAEPPALDPPSPQELDECPFCEGREDRTPPETFAVCPPGREPDTPGWQVRVIPNLYPAFEHQEVVVHTPRHARSIGELTDEELSAVASAWQQRLAAANEAGFDYPQLLLNEGREAGASLPHSHSQLVWLRESPPESAAELPRLSKGDCALCEVLRDESLEIALDGDLSLRAAPAGRVPYELLIAPRAHSAQPGRDGLETGLRLLREAILRLHEVHGPVPLNAWLHAGAHWHFEVVPRLTVLAGLELGAGLYVNWQPPEKAAQELRAVAL